MDNSQENKIQGLGKRLKVYRKSVKLTQEQIAEIIGIDTLYYATIEREERVPSLKMLYRICQNLDISPGSLLDTPQESDTVTDELKEILHIEIEQLNSKQAQILLSFIKHTLPLI